MQEIEELRYLIAQLDGQISDGMPYPAAVRVQEEFTEALDALLKGVLIPTGERFRHEKRGTSYDVFGFGHANSSDTYFVSSSPNAMGGGPIKKVIFDRDEVVIYRDVQSGHVSVRTVKEFGDGRFTQLPNRPGHAALDHQQTVAGKLGRPAPAAPAATPARAVRASEDGPRRVRYVGPYDPLSGKEGTISEWLDGAVKVVWDDTEAAQIITTLNVELI